MLLIREETPKDHEEVRRVIRRAFENAEHTDHDEHNLVDRLRKSDAFIPELSLVAEMDGKIIGHVLFSKIRIQEDSIQQAHDNFTDAIWVPEIFQGIVKRSA